MLKEVEAGIPHDPILAIRAKQVDLDITIILHFLSYS